MPYNIPSEKGGDSTRNVARMAQCVQSVMNDGKSKSQAIAICKSSLGFTSEGRKRRRVSG